MSAPNRILLKTTIPLTADDWHVGRFSLLTRHLMTLKDARGVPSYVVTAKDRVETTAGNDADLEAAAAGNFDQLWLFAVDVTGALTAGDVDSIAKFRAGGGGVFLTRDHQDLGACLTKLGSLGATQHFQNHNPEPDPARRCRDDTGTPTITWPNYHSGANGDLQALETPRPLHPIALRVSGEPLRFLPSHPHEGSVGVPPELKDVARVVVAGRSRATGATFNLCVAVNEPRVGRAVSDSSFHHLCDYNWDPRLGAPSFVDEPPGDAILRDPEGLADARQYAANIAAWLGGRP